MEIAQNKKFRLCIHKIKNREKEEEAELIRMVGSGDLMVIEALKPSRLDAKFNV